MLSWRDGPVAQSLLKGPWAQPVGRKASTKMRRLFFETLCIRFPVNPKNLQWTCLGGSFAQSNLDDEFVAKSHLHAHKNFRTKMNRVCE